MNISNIIITIIISFSFVNVNNEIIESNRERSAINKESVLRHVVLFKFKEDASKERIKEVEKAFEALSSKIPEIMDFEWGLNNSPEGLDKGFTHCYLITFKNEEDRSIYLPHPDHQAFVQLLDGLLEDVLVVDYWTEK